MHVIVMFKLKVIVEPHGSTSFVVSSNLIADRLTIIAFHGNGRVSTNTDGTAAITTIYNSCCSNAQPSRCRFSKAASTSIATCFDLSARKPSFWYAAAISYQLLYPSPGYSR